MSQRSLWYLAKGLELIGMLAVLIGVFISMSEGFQDKSLSSMQYEMWGLSIGGALFVVGWLIERKLGAR